MRSRTYKATAPQSITTESDARARLRYHVAYLAEARYVRIAGEGFRFQNPEGATAEVTANGDVILTGSVAARTAHE